MPESPGGAVPPEGCGMQDGERRGRRKKVSGAFVAIARAALQECGGDRAEARRLLYNLGREEDRFFSLAERARLALGVLDALPTDGISARAVIESELMEMERLALESPPRS